MAAHPNAVQAEVAHGVDLEKADGAQDSSITRRHNATTTPENAVDNTGASTDKEMSSSVRRSPPNSMNKDGVAAIDLAAYDAAQDRQEGLVESRHAQLWAKIKGPKNIFLHAALGLLLTG